MSRHWLRGLEATGVTLAIMACGSGGSDVTTGVDGGDGGSSSSSGSSGASSGGSSGNGSSSGTTPGAENPLARALCKKLFGCCTDGELANELKFYDPTPATEDECTTMFTGLIAYETASIQKAEDEGRVTFAPEMAGACAAAIDAAACTAWDAKGDPFGTLVDDPSCTAIVTPKVAAGGTCGHDRECTSKNCDLVAKQCEARTGGEIGEACPCASDLRCFDGANAGDPPSCAPPRLGGGACDAPSECRSRRCESGSCVGICDGR